MTVFAPRTVVVGMDGSRAAWDAMHWAADEASHTGRQLVVIHAGDTRADPSSADERPYGKALLCEAVASLVNSHPRLTVETKLSAGDPAEELIDASASADLVVVGLGRRGLPTLLLGTVARRVLMHASCPTVVVPRSQRSYANRIVVGVADTAGGRAALHFAFSEAALRGAEVVAVRSWSPFEWQLTPVAAGGAVSGRTTAARESAENSLLTASLLPYRAEFPQVRVRAVLSSDPVEVALRREARSSVALVLGCRRSEDALLGRMGPIASWSVKHFDLPIVVVGQHPVAADNHRLAADETAFAWSADV